ncbi:MAG: hypothetical protein WAU65_01880 [Candidatus Nanoarchaeia archaeon]
MKMKKRDTILGILLVSILLALSLQNIILVSATSTSTVCAIKTTYGAWCQDVLPNQVDSAYPSYTTSCAAVPDCSGTCVDTILGLCSSSSKYACQSSPGGSYSSTPVAQTPQCLYGCCLLGDQASFTTQANCVVLSSEAGVNLNFDGNVNDEPTCISMATPEAKGACTEQTGTGLTCLFTTHTNCNSMNTSGTVTSFYPNFLCTNPVLGTNCVKTQETTCSSASDQIFYIDSCGNTANIYDQKQYTNESYWDYLVASAPDSDNAGDVESASNGNCNYLAGSTCMKYDPTIDSSKPAIGDYICRDLNCKSGTFVPQFVQTYGTQRQSNQILQYPVNGESWCGTESNGNLVFGGDPGSSSSSTPGQSGSGNNGFGTGSVSYTLPDTVTFNKSLDLPGNVDTLFICQNGEITTETYDARQKVCVQNETSNGYFSSYLTLNRWQDCYYQNSSKSCLDNTTRDCQWIIGYSILKDNSTGLPYVYDSVNDILVPRQDDTSRALDPRPGASCVPKYTPGFDISVNGLLSSSGNLNIQGPSAKDLCFMGSMVCYENYTRSKGASIFNAPWAISPANDVVCLDNGESLSQPWASSVSNICSSIGDCGVSVNYIGTSGTNGMNDLFKILLGKPSYG